MNDGQSYAEQALNAARNIEVEVRSCQDVWEENPFVQEWLQEVAAIIDNLPRLDAVIAEEFSSRPPTTRNKALEAP